jgi:stearoyl-CoA desaturase (delta-9 desaturase)
MNKFWEKFFYLFTYLTQGASYLTPRPYAIMHRMHHAYSDTEKDPHSPLFFKEVITMMKYTYKIFSGIHTNKLEYDEKFDMYLYEEIGYPILTTLTMGLFCSPYGATSVREYFANAFEHYFTKSPQYVKKLSPSAYKKVVLLTTPDYFDKISY